MGWNGTGGVVRTDGTRTGSDTWEQARDAGVKILAADHDTHDQDLAEAIGRCLNLDGENQMASDLKAGGHKLVNVAPGTAALDGVTLRQTQMQGYLWGGTSGGTANVRTISLSPAPAAYAAGMAVRFISHEANSGPVTLNVNGQGAVNLRDRGGSVLAANALGSGDVIEAVHNGSAQFRVTHVVRSADIVNDAVTDAKLRNSAALSVIGRSANSTGDPGDISAGTDGHVLRRSGTTLGFGQVATAGIADSAVTSAKLGGSAVTTAAINNLAVTTDKLDTSAVTAAKLANDAVIAAKIENNAVIASKIGSAAVLRAKLKTSTTTLTGSTAANIELPAYSFFPMISSQTAVGIFSHATAGTADEPRFRIVSGGGNYDIRCRHIDAS